MPEQARYLPEALRNSGEFTLYRGHEPGEAASVLVVAPAAEQPSPQSLRQLEHECSLAADLDPSWAVRPLEVTRRDGRTMLILEDPGGEPLDRILERSEGQPLELTRVLRIAIRLATALGRVHRQGLIHKDIKPANVLVDDADNVWLTGFGIASRLRRESQAPAPPEIIEHLYEQAIRSAHANGFVQNEALANELAARFYAARGFEKIAQTYVRDARYCYLRWGADGKVRQLDQSHPHLREEEPKPGPTSTIGAPVEHLDLATIIKVSQAVSGEIVLDTLLDTLMRTAIEHAGAE